MASLNYIILQDATERRFSQRNEERQRQQNVNIDDRERQERKRHQNVQADYDEQRKRNELEQRSWQEKRQSLKTNRKKQRNQQQEKKHQKHQQEKQVRIPSPPARKMSPRPVTKRTSLRKKGSKTKTKTKKTESTSTMTKNEKDNRQQKVQAQSEVPSRPVLTRRDMLLQHQYNHDKKYNNDDNKGINALAAVMGTTSCVVNGKNSSLEATIQRKNSTASKSVRGKEKETDETDTTASSTTNSGSFLRTKSGSFVFQGNEDIEVPVNEDIEVPAFAESEERIHVLDDDEASSVYSDIDIISDFDFGADNLNGSSQNDDFDEIWSTTDSDDGNNIPLSQSHQQHDQQLVDDEEYYEEEIIEELEEEIIYDDDEEEFFEEIIEEEEEDEVAELSDDNHDFDDDKTEGEGENWFDIRPQPVRIKSEITIDSTLLPRRQPPPPPPRRHLSKYAMSQMSFLTMDEDLYTDDE